MSGQIVGQIVGTVIGFTIGGPIGGAIGGGIGSAVGSSFDTLPTQYGPRLDDLRAQRSEYGSPIPVPYGTVALQGNVIYAQDIKEVKTETEQGGKGGPSQTSVAYSYFGNFAVAICDGPIGGVLRIWAGPAKRLIYDGVALEGGNIRIYLGTDDQMPDPLIEADKGIGFAPAYRGTAYVVFEDFPLAKDGNTLPFLTFEVTTGDNGGTCGTDYTTVGAYRLYDRPPEKLGSFQDMYAAAGVHGVASDNAGNIYALMRQGVGTYSWYLKKVSSTTPITEDIIPLGSAFASILDCRIAYHPAADVLGIVQRDSKQFCIVDCPSFAIVSIEELDTYKDDIIYYEAEQRFRYVDSSPQYIDGILSPDSYGITETRGSTRLIDCGPHGLAVSLDRGTLASKTYLNGAVLCEKCTQIYDPVRDRLLAIVGSADSYYGYYDFATGETVTPSDGKGRINPVYMPLIDRIIYYSSEGMFVVNPADISPDGIPDECQIYGGTLVYADGTTPVADNGRFGVPVSLGTARNMFAVVPGSNAVPNADIFTFKIGVTGAGVTLASVVADLSERAGESRYDVSQLESDIVDGYVIARQTTVRAAIDALRPAYYFDAVESQSVIKYVKRGGSEVTVIDDEDLGARDAGSEPSDPLQTVRRMEVELPRAVNVKYLRAADDYNQATKQARRLIGSSGDELTIEVPLVLTDTKAQEVAEVNLHAAWAERLSYQFTLPRKYSKLEPTDLVLVKGHLMRLTKVKDTPRGVRECEAVANESSYYAPHVVVTETQPTVSTVSKPGVTLMELF